MIEEKILAIITARSGSKGIPDKNIVRLKGKPLMAWTIESAVNSGIFTNIVVSTDSKKYADIALKYGAEVPFLREKELAGDRVSSLDVIMDVLDRMEEKGYSYQYFILLQPTSPLRDGNDIKNAFDEILKRKGNSLVSVSHVKHTPQSIFQIGENGSIDHLSYKKGFTRRQDMEKYYSLNGAIYIAEIESFKKNKSFYTDNAYVYVMSKEKSIDIDDTLDLKLAEIIMDQPISLQCSF